ncbi:S-adenosyl-L-methionine-dependent tRNA 4-demethylwyosine synthase [uncultured archaeon]|nr:S-adenosyl-L-methionine-dependent tRNA 4-demethylwyosine synthase [uncultured archaeon]
MARTKGETGSGKYYSQTRSSNKSIPDAMLKLLMRQKYHVAGEHSAAKLCHWADLALKGHDGCYKNKFYGIASHRCLQCTPCLLFCNHACVFCWRFMPEKKMKFEDVRVERFEWDAPEEIADWLISAQRKIISGYGGNKLVARSLYKEAMSPKHVAISLTGEPTMYPRLEELISEFHRRGMTTFLVTNGTFPERVEKWKTYPTQFYVSMVAPNEKIYVPAIRPASPALWKKYRRTLALMPQIGKKTRTVLRMTLTRGINDSDLGGYAKQIKLAQPHYVEVKSMVFVGGARQEGRGLSPNSMLEMDEVEKIAEELAGMTGYLVSEKHEPSRIALLCRDFEAEKNKMIKWL